MTQQQTTKQQQWKVKCPVDFPTGVLMPVCADSGNWYKAIQIDGCTLVYSVRKPQVIWLAWNIRTWRDLRRNIYFNEEVI